MTVAEFVLRLQERGFKGHTSGSGYRFQCPAHGGGDCNLAIDAGDDGRVLVTCHSRHCAFEAIARALDLEPRELMPHPEGHRGANGSAGNEKVYPYRDERGELLFEVVRKGDKKFTQRRPDPVKPGEWLWNLEGVRRVLFGVPELLKTAPGDVVAICEGEKDAVNVAAAGIAATTNPHGATRWRPEFTAWLAEHLADRKFLICADNDEEGIKHGEQVYAALKAAGLEVYVADLGRLPAKGDVSDWLKAGGTAEHLRAMAAPTPHPLDLKVIGGRALEEMELPSPEALVPHLLYRGFSTLLAGDSKLGKSSLLLRALLGLSCGGWWLDPDFRSENRLPESRLLFINFEDPLFLTRWRAQKMMQGEHIPENFLTMEPPYGWSLSQLIDWIAGAYQRLALDAVILDPIAIAAEWQDETDNSEVARTFKALQRLAAETQLAVLSSHHVTKKPGERGLNIRGGSAIKANVLGYLVLEPDKDLFKLAGINKLAGEWDVTLNRSERDWSWWIVESRAGSTRTPQQTAKEQAKADLLGLIAAEPGVTTERLMELLELAKTSCHRYLSEMEEAGLIVRREIQAAESREGRPPIGWFRVQWEPEE